MQLAITEESTKIKPVPSPVKLHPTEGIIQWKIPVNTISAVA